MAASAAAQEGSELVAYGAVHGDANPLVWAGARRYTAHGLQGLLVLAYFARAGLTELADDASTSAGVIARRILDRAPAAARYATGEVRCLIYVLAAAEVDEVALRHAALQAWRKDQFVAVVGLLDFNIVVLRRLADHRHLPPRELARTLTQD